MYLLLSEGSSELCACGDSSVFQVRNENSRRGQICKLACLNLCEVRDNAIDKVVDVRVSMVEVIEWYREMIQNCDR